MLFQLLALVKSAWPLQEELVMEKKMIIGDKNEENASNISKIMNDAGFDTVPFVMDLSNRESILSMIKEG